MARITIGPRQAGANPAWAKDYLNREHLIAGGSIVDPAQFPRDNAVAVTVGAGGAAQGATSIPVTALAGPIPAGSSLRFNNGLQTFVTADAAAGATAITVQALPFAVAAGATSQYLGTGRVYIRNGTVVGRTYAERDAGTGFGPVSDGDVAAGAGEAYILAHDIDDALDNPSATLYRHGSMVDEAHFPGWASLSAAVRTYLRTNYQCMRGAD